MRAGSLALGELQGMHQKREIFLQAGKRGKRTQSCNVLQQRCLGFLAKEIAAAWTPMIESFWLPYFLLASWRPPVEAVLERGQEFCLL